MEKARVIIVGSGFAGVTLAEHLNRRAAPGIEVVAFSSSPTGLAQPRSES